MQVLPSLFGDWTVLREWGRRGSPGTLRLDSYRWHDEARSAEFVELNGMQGAD